MNIPKNRNNSKWSSEKMNIDRKKILDESAIAENLKLVIEWTGLSQERFGALIGRSKTAISGFVNVKSGNFPSQLFREIGTLGISMDWYLKGEGEMYHNPILPEEAAEAKYYEQAGRLLEEAINYISQAKSIQECMVTGKQKEIAVPEKNHNHHRDLAEDNPRTTEHSEVKKSSKNTPNIPPPPPALMTYKRQKTR